MKRAARDVGQDRPPAAFCGVSASTDDSRSRRASAREFFTVDLRGLRAALAAGAAEQGATESDVLRGALASALDGHRSSTSVTGPGVDDRQPPIARVKLSVRLSQAAALRLDHNAHAAGLSRGAYLTRLIYGAPPIASAADRAAGAAALSVSSAELAVLSRDISHLTRLLRRGDVEPARQYRLRLDTLDADIRAHLDLAATVLAGLSSSAANHQRSAST